MCERVLHLVVRVAGRHIEGPAQLGVLNAGPLVGDARGDEPAPAGDFADDAGLPADELGLRIPADLSVVGYDNTTLASSAPINLTSVDQAGHDLGATAARLLGERMDGRSRSVLTSAAPQLIIRNTTGPPRS